MWPTGISAIIPLDAEVSVELESLLVIHPDAEGVIVLRAEKVDSRVRVIIASEEPGLSSTQEPHPPALVLIPGSRSLV